MTHSYIELNPSAQAPLILLGEHAGFSIPEPMNRLGVDRSTFQNDPNFAGDHGTRHILFYLARKLNLTSILGRHSRLVIDLNRELNTTELFWKKHHNIEIPKNSELSPLEKQQRVNQYYTPFHNAVRAQIERFFQMGKKPTLLTIHSYTPTIAYKTTAPTGSSTKALTSENPIDIGLLYAKPGPLLTYADQAFEKTPWSTAHNHPYNLLAINSGSLIMHQNAYDLDGLALEINVNLLASTKEQQYMGQTLAQIIEPFLSMAS